MAKLTIGILGGTGFVGHALCWRLVKAGHMVRVLSRHVERHRDLEVLPSLTLLAGDPSDSASMDELLQGCDVAINLIGILNETSASGLQFNDVHVMMVHRVVEACVRKNVPRYLHMSALGADPNKPSVYFQTKAAGEQFALSQDRLQVTSFRPNIIFGPGDNFFCRFAQLLSLSPRIFFLPVPASRYAPVYVGDVVDMFVQSLDNKRTFGQAYNICGPVQYTLKDLVQYTAQLMQKRVLIVGLNDTFSSIAATVMAWLPGKPFSRDNFLTAKSADLRPYPLPPVFALHLHSVESIVPGYIGPHRFKSPFANFRRVG